jgi:hypothetical protein
MVWLQKCCLWSSFNFLTNPAWNLSSVLLLTKQPLILAARILGKMAALSVLYVEATCFKSCLGTSSPVRTFSFLCVCFRKIPRLYLKIGLYHFCGMPLLHQNFQCTSIIQHYTNFTDVFCDVCESVIFFFHEQECTGSICLAYGLESCQCIPGPHDSKIKACELCCKIPGDDQPCLWVCRMPTYNFSSHFAFLNCQVILFY